MISIALSVSDRLPPTVHRTLGELFATDPSVGQVTVHVGGVDVEVLGGWETDHRVTARLCPSRDFDELRRSISRAKSRVATRIALSSGTGPIIVLHDSLRFAPDWCRTTLATLARMAATKVPLDRSVVALYSPHEYLQQPFDAYPPETLAGCQAIYVGSAVRPRMVEALGTWRVESDFVVARELLLAEARKWKLFALVPSVVQVVGVGASSPSFERAALERAQASAWDRGAAESWLGAYAARISKTVAWIRGNGLDVFPCRCSDPACQGWKVEKVAVAEENFRLSGRY
jgi:hypothetical protein